MRIEREMNSIFAFGSAVGLALGVLFAGLMNVSIYTILVFVVVVFLIGIWELVNSRKKTKGKINIR